MIGRPTDEEVQACLSLHERLRTYLDVVNDYDRVATVECVREDILGHVVEEEGAEVIQLAPAALDDTPPKVKDPIEKVNVGSESEPMTVAISTYLEPDQRQGLVSLLMEFKDCFAEKYEDIPGLSPDLVCHQLPTLPNKKPIQQAPRRMNADTMVSVKEEVEKMHKSGIIRVAKYNEWLSNIVPVRKKNGKMRVCVDYRDLNNATPKDVYPMPVADLLVDAVARHELLSFMDGTAGYHQIPVADADRHKTTFRCPGFTGAFEYVVMPFGLKNAGSTYQRAMNLIFHDILGMILEVYIDDVVVKSKFKADHLVDLRMVFERMRLHKLKMNPAKCVFGVQAGDFLGFLVHQSGIEVPGDKVKAVIDAPAPR